MFFYNFISNVAVSRLATSLKFISSRSLLACLMMFLPISYIYSADRNHDGYNLLFEKPASNWNEAMPIGNGFIGAMVYGGVSQERIQFTEHSLCTGDMKKVGNFQPMGEIFIDYGIGDSCNDYSRRLSLDKAVCDINYKTSSYSVHRQVFASFPNKVVAVRCDVDGRRLPSVAVRLESFHANNVTYAGNDAFFEGRFSNGLQYGAHIRVVPDNGTSVKACDDRLELENCSGFTLLLSASTSYVPDYKCKFLGQNPMSDLFSYINRASSMTYEELKSIHEADFRNLYGRCDLILEDPFDGREIAIDKRIERYRGGEDDPWLEALVFQFGRYLLISSSREGGLPANLQGLWNKERKPAWYSQYTTDINLQMNYWLAEPTGLSECHMQMLDWIENISEVQKMSDDPRLSTDKAWKAYSTMNFMGGTSGWALHLPGPAWLLQHFWLHYAYGGDKKFLEERAYPLLKEMAEFWADRLIEKDGFLITPDGWSPEHGPGLVEGDRTPRPGVSYDQEIVYDLFTNYISASEILGKDSVFRNRIISVREHLLWPRIGKWGQLQEWMEDLDSPKDHHRHLSHLFAVHPGYQISPVTTPDLAEAALVSLKSRGTESTGWSTAWRIGMYARLFKAEEAHFFARKLIEKCLLPNLFSLHPPFQIDANFGYSGGIVEMLVQNVDGKILLLPSIPDNWSKEGTAVGLRAFGGVTIDMSWRDGRITDLKLYSSKGGRYKICLGHDTDNVIEVVVKSNETKTVRVD